MMPTTDQTHQVVHPLHGAGLMQGNLLERHALQLVCRVRTSKTRMVSVHWCYTSGSHDYLSKLWGAITAHNPHTLTTTTAARKRKGVRKKRS